MNPIPPSPPKIKRLGELLIEENLINPEQLEKGLNESKKLGEPLGKILLKRGYLSEDQLGKVLSIQAGTAYIKIGNRDFNQSLFELFPKNFLWERRLLPLSLEGRTLKVVMVRPNDFDTLDDIRLITGLRPVVVMTTAKEFEETHRLLFNEQQQITEALATCLVVPENPSSQRSLDESGDDQSVVKLVQSILTDAVTKGASDIHMESREQTMEVRFRIDGSLQRAAEIPKGLESQAVSRVKIISGMDISEKRLPQDGHSRVAVDGKNFDLRINTLPNVWGERVVIRILRPAMLFGGFDSLGLSPYNFKALNNLIQMPHGVALITGPTGSGKTTTLYSALYEMNSPNHNILTIEDPVEYPIEGISQTQVSAKAGLSFAQALRSMLRQDPDIIMVGEIRDKETLDAAIFAALTGHLVLSTIHANDAANTVTRMLEMGLASYLLSSAVGGVVAQRLVKKICPFCITTKLGAEAGIDIPLLADKKVSQGAGCSRCNQKGYSGRLGIFEILTFTDSIREMVDKEASAHRIRNEAIQQGMETLARDGYNKILAGLTTVQEVNRALGPNWHRELCHSSAIAPST